ncbi:hypothetical protein B0H34DRAFT_863213 [Crassisporium funariophilum]|nr:hypothetical protein B0H34DRAFT_863213 [Crassisporium funariophilum]
MSYTRLTQAALATIPFVEALPDPHIVLDVAVPKPGEPNYRKPTYRHRKKPFYIPPNFLAIIDNTDPNHMDLGFDQPRCWTRPSWGWVGFRIDYSHTDDEWAAVKKRIWERYKYNQYSDVEKFRILWIEDRERFEGKDLGEVRKAFREWCGVHLGCEWAESKWMSDITILEWDCYNFELCLVADRRAITEILADIATHTPLPDEHEGEHSVSASLIVLDKLNPGNTSEADMEPASEEEVEFWQAEGVAIFPGYRGYMRSSIDDISCLWLDTMGVGEPPEVFVAFARRADKRPGKVFTEISCTDV